MSSGVLELDFIEELRMRRWARENYCPRDRRESSWHPVVHEEMEKKDREASRPHEAAASYSWSKS
ncbi:MAG: hypothetical protein U0793_12865 [Gemmataceae bacterium]